MKYIIGIGNPGKKYESTRHNIGFMAVSALSAAFAPGSWKKDGSLKAMVYKTADAWFFKPETFVNLTGDTVREIIKQRGAQKEDFLFLCDDVNLEFGKLRLRATGSAGGHHGLESALQLFGEDFARLRIGVGRQDMPKDLTGFVLEKFDKEEVRSLDEIVAKTVSVSQEWIQNGFDAALARLSQLQSKNV